MRREKSKEKGMDLVIKKIQESKKLRLEDFELSRTLGIGTFGKVKLCFFKKANSRQPLALKMLKKQEILKLNQVDHIKAEKWILSEIEHPNIVKLIGSF